LRAAFQKYESAFTGFRIDIAYIIADDEHVVVQYTFVGTFKGSLSGYPPTGYTLRVPSVMVLRISDSRLVEQYFLWDNLGPRRKLWLATVVERQYGTHNVEIPSIE
jgi:predicted ester cyclase